MKPINMMKGNLLTTLDISTDFALKKKVSPIVGTPDAAGPLVPIRESMGDNN